MLNTQIDGFTLYIVYNQRQYNKTDSVTFSFTSEKIGSAKIVVRAKKHILCKVNLGG